MTILTILGHPDDEYFFASRIAFERARGHRIICVFLTDGTAYGVSPKVRENESRRALAELGLANEDLHFLGIKDSESYTLLEELYTRVKEIADRTSISSIFVLAWEGGHVDHDAAHLIGIALARSLGILDSLFEFAGYNGYGVPGKLFRVFRMIPNRLPVRRRRLSIREAVRSFLLFRWYRSQLKSFIGLMPDSFYRIVLRRGEEMRPVANIDYRLPPHPGALLYERRFGVAFSKFRQAAGPFIEKFIL